MWPLVVVGLAMLWLFTRNGTERVVTKGVRGVAEEGFDAGKALVEDLGYHVGSILFQPEEMPEVSFTLSASRLCDKLYEAYPVSQSKIRAVAMAYVERLIQNPHGANRADCLAKLGQFFQRTPDEIDSTLKQYQIG